MDTIAQTNEKLVLEDKPVLGKLMSYLLVGAGVILILPNPYKPNPDYLMYIGIVMFFGGFVLMRFLRPAVTCTFDKGNGKLTIARIRHFRSSEQDTYPLGEIDKIRIESHQERTGTKYRLSPQNASTKMGSINRTIYSGRFSYTRVHREKNSGLLIDKVL